MATYYNLPDQMSYILSQGADIYAKTGNVGDPPTSTAAYEGHCEVVRILLDNGCNIETLDGKGCTSIFVAALPGYTPRDGFIIAKMQS